MFSADDLLDDPRRRFERILAQHCDAGDAFALMLVDLDNFASVSRTARRQAADLVLYEVTGRLRDMLGEGAIVTHSRSSQFAIMVDGVTEIEAAERLAKSLIERLQRSMYVAGTRFRLSASIGITLFPRDGNDWQSLLQQADAAACDARALGRGRVSISFPPPLVSDA